jgi:hypothetical protein
MPVCDKGSGMATSAAHGNFCTEKTLVVNRGMREN